MTAVRFLVRTIVAIIAGCALLAMVIAGGFLYTHLTDPDFDGAIAAPGTPGQPRATTAWASYGGDGAAKFADLARLTKDNVGDLEIAWAYRTGDTSDVFQVTPILADGRLVLCTPRNNVIALDPLTGVELWRFDAQIGDQEFDNQTNCRGVSQWQGAATLDCPARIFTATNDARLIALDATTGKRCASFGHNGEINLQTGVGDLRNPGEYQVAMPPAVVSNVVVVGASIGDNKRTDAPSGVVRGFDAISGALEWAFDFAPPDFDYQRDPVSSAGYALSTPNVWAAISVDEARDMVFLPTGNPGPDYFRTGKPDLDFYGSSVVALRASTGEYLWHFQTVINDFWDFDVPSAPSLVELTINGEAVPALIQSTKMGFVFILNRVTGEPLVDIDYRQVPVHGPLAAELSPVQPFPPEAFQLSRANEPANWLLKLAGLCAADDIIGPVYTPITEDWTLGLPSNMGTTNWGGAAVDGDRGLIAVRSSNMAFRTKLLARADAEAFMVNNRIDDWDGFRARFDLPSGVEIGLQEGADYLMARHMSPCSGLPAGELTVVDINARQQLWRQPHGSVRDVIGLGIDVGMPGLSGPLLTSTGLIFVSGGMTERAIRAFDVHTGEELWHHRLPLPGNATPMAYTVEDADGVERPMVVIAAGGDGRSPIGSVGDYIVGFTLTP
ncbi:MAG: PQQ-binding-like beta-propeller repeat protein [Pseudomonadaceae bacterium]|nr:PQQ-binding-like beta-propeller repeat protein [Pseudomonadaceae bacterium]